MKVRNRVISLVLLITLLVSNCCFTENVQKADAAIDESAMTREIIPTDIVFDYEEAVQWVSSGESSEDVAIWLSTKDYNYSCCLRSPSMTSYSPYVNLDFTKISSFDASEYKYMTIVAKTSASNTNAGMFLCAGDITTPNVNSYKSWKWINDGFWHEYVIDLSTLSEWNGMVNKIQFDFFEGSTPENSAVYLHSMRFTTTKPEKPTLSADTDVFDEREKIEFTYSGIISYIGENEEISPYIAIYKEGKYPGDRSYVCRANINDTNGTKIFPTDRSVTTISSYLPAGNYTAWIAYEARNSDYELTVVDVLAEGFEPYSFSIKEKCSETPAYSLITGGYTSEKIIRVGLVDTIGGAMDGIWNLMNASSIFISGAVGKTTAYDVFTGLVASVDSQDYTIVVMGDTDGDGVTTVADAMSAVNHIRGSKKLSGAYADAAKAEDRTGDIDIIDVMAILNRI